MEKLKKLFNEITSKYANEVIDGSFEQYNENYAGFEITLINRTFISAEIQNEETIKTNKITIIKDGENEVVKTTIDYFDINSLNNIINQDSHSTTDLEFALTAISELFHISNANKKVVDDFCNDYNISLQRLLDYAQSKKHQNLKEKNAGKKMAEEIIQKQIEAINFYLS